MATKEKTFRIEDIEPKEIEALFDTYPDIARRLAHLMRTGKIGLLLVHYSYLKDKIPENVRKSEKFDLFDITAFIFLKLNEPELISYKLGHVTIDEIEEKIKNSIKTWCRKNLLPFVQDLDNLKLKK